MAFEKCGSCILYRDPRLNEPNANPNWPPFTGLGEANGVDMWVSAYVNTADESHALVKKGKLKIGDKFFSVTFQPRGGKPSGGQQAMPSPTTRKSPSSKCPGRCKMSDWLDLPGTDYRGYIVTNCKKCGRWLGNRRPVDVSAKKPRRSSDVREHSEPKICLWNTMPGTGEYTS